MKVKLKSKRVLKRMQQHDVNNACIGWDNLLKMQSRLHSNCGRSETGRYLVPHSEYAGYWYIPKHYIGKVVRK